MATRAIAVRTDEDKLTDKQAAFVDHWLRLRNGPQAYRLAYDTSTMGDTSVGREASVLLANPKIAAVIKDRRAILARESVVDAEWLLNRFLAIATADPRELIGMKVGCCRYCYGEGHGYHWREREYMEAMAKVEHEARAAPFRAANLLWPDVGGGFGFNATHPPRGDCPQCHGEGIERFVPRDSDNFSEQAALLYGGVKVKKDGYEIVIADRAKALELAGRILGAFNDKVRVSGAIAHAHAVADLRDVDPAQAAKVYRDFVTAHLTA